MVSPHTNQTNPRLTTTNPNTQHGGTNQKQLNPDKTWLTRKNTCQKSKFDELLKFRLFLAFKISPLQRGVRWPHGVAIPLFFFERNRRNFRSEAGAGCGGASFQMFRFWYFCLLPGRGCLTVPSLSGNVGVKVAWSPWI